MKKLHANEIRFYFRSEWRVLIIVTIFGLIYNVGLLANPWFDGQLAGCLVAILTGKSTFQSMLILVIWYVLIILGVQVARYLKRLYVRRFANNINRRMKKIIYRDLLSRSRKQLQSEGVGNVMTKAISDVDDCVEGMRKFTTEVFDTGVALLCYAIMLLYYDWRLALICMLFPPVSYFIAEKMKYMVQRTGAACKEEAGRLNADTLDRVQNALTYRIFGCEKQRNDAYEKRLSAYEKSAVKSNIWVSALPPLYHVICMAGVIFIFFFGSQNVLQTGWKSWDIAAFATFLSCYTKLSVKSSKTAKLFNAVHKAQVSWKRIRPFLNEKEENLQKLPVSSGTLCINDLSFSYPDGTQIFSHLNLTAKPGDWIGITGPVACGKSTFGRVFLCEDSYQGSIRYNNEEFSQMPDRKRNALTGYLGHDYELLSDSIRNNILLGDDDDLTTLLHTVCFWDEVEQMSDKADTLIGSGGTRLSGGQGQRVALARTLHHDAPVFILDDPFSALDQTTEERIYANLREQYPDSIFLIISHRLGLFNQFEQVIWMGDKTPVTGTHETFMQTIPLYAQMYRTQKGESYEK